MAFPVNEQWDQEDNVWRQPQSQGGGGGGGGMVGGGGLAQVPEHLSLLYYSRA